jgi:hypothetical protein
MRLDPNAAVPYPRASYEQIPYQQIPYQQAAPTYPDTSFGAWQETARPQSADPRTEATLARVRLAQRKAKRMLVGCVLLGVCTVAIFLAAASSHQLDAHIEMLTPVLLLTSAVNSRRYAQRAAQYRAAEADLLARAN